MPQFDDAKVGDKVWSVANGWGKITGVDNSDNYPIEVTYDNENWASYKSDGREFSSEPNPTLFWDEVKIVPPERPKEKCEACERLAMLDEQVWHPTLLNILNFFLNQHHTCEKKGVSK